jgi:hypothetical protein
LEEQYIEFLIHVFLSVSHTKMASTPLKSRCKVEVSENGFRQAISASNVQGDFALCSVIFVVYEPQRWVE